MKKYFILILLFSLHTAFSQQTNVVSLTFNKTVHMFFPSDISYYDVGSDDILVQSQNEILKLAPKSNNFSETNLTVITSDNYCYSYLLQYKSDISELTYFIKDSTGRKISSSSRNKINADSLDKDSQNLYNNTESSYIAVCREIIKKAPAYWIGSTVKKVYLAMNNIYVHNDKLYFCVTVGNASNINYDIKYIKYYTVDKNKLKKASNQEIEKIPIFSFNYLPTIDARTNDHPIIFVFDKFTIDNDKKLYIDLGEKKGGRNIKINITQDLIIKAVAFK
jgi:conjugative transposon TraN protein